MDDGSNYVSAVINKVNNELPGLDPELAQLYALLALVKGDATSLEDVHDAWAVWTAATRGSHRSLLPFTELTTDVQELDREYMNGIHRAANCASPTTTERKAGTE